MVTDAHYDSASALLLVEAFGLEVEGDPADRDRVAVDRAGLVERLLDTCTAQPRLKVRAGLLVVHLGDDDHALDMPAAHRIGVGRGPRDREVLVFGRRVDI